MKFLLGLCIAGLCSAWGSDNSDKVLLKDVHTLVLYNRQMTTGRRSSPVEQLKCIGSECHSVDVDYMQCDNMGYAGRKDIQWKCAAYPEMDKQYTLASVKVGCEGYRDKNDPYVLEGSCGVTYSIKRTMAGNNRPQGYSNQGHSNQGQGGSYYDSGRQQSYQQYSSSSYNPYSGQPSGSSTGRWVLFFIIAAALGYFMFFRNNNNNNNNGGGGRATGTGYGGGGYGGGGGGGGRPGGGGGGGGGTSTSGYGGSYTQTQNPPRPPQPPQQHGMFGGWGNFLGGAALGYMMGGTGQNYGQNYGYGAAHHGYGAGYGGGMGGGNYGYGGGGYGGGGGGGGNSGGGTHTATGFGGTDNR